MIFITRIVYFQIICKFLNLREGTNVSAILARNLNLYRMEFVLNNSYLLYFSLTLHKISTN